MSQGPYQPGYEPEDGAPRQSRDGFPDAPTGRASARVPQPDWSPPQRPDSGPPSNYPPPQYAGPESPYDPQAQYRRPEQPYGAPEQSGFGGQQQGGFGGQQQPGGYGGQQQSGGYGGQQPGGYGAPPGGEGPPTGRIGGSASVSGAAGGGYGQQSYSPYGDPARSQYSDPTQYGDRGGPESSRFSALRYDEPGPGGLGAPEPPKKSKRGLIIGIVIAAVVVLALAAGGITYLLSSKSTSTFAVNSCVKRSGDKAETVSCSTAGSYQIVSKVGSPSQCPDQGQPYVVLQEKGKADQVLCLKPSK